MEQSELTGRFSERPQRFAWFLGAGASRTAGLPTAADIVWDLKRRYYCREENQQISRQDIQNAAVRARIQSFVESRGFPTLWADGEYPAYFEKIFGDDYERQRRYLKAVLSEDKVALSVGCRVMGALLASGLCRTVFTTNFDSVIEKAVAEVAGQSLAAYHLEGPSAAQQALNNEEFPLYCKLHGDFRYQSLKNLPDDLVSQNEDLSNCLVNAANRFGFVVAGFSGRDESVMTLFRNALASNNPFPHGLYWTGIKGSPVHPAVTALLEQALSRGVTAAYVAIETYDALMLRFCRNLESKAPSMDSKVCRSDSTAVDISLPGAGRMPPILRLNALPLLSIPTQCQKLQFGAAMEWPDLKAAHRNAPGQLILTKTEEILCWAQPGALELAFGNDLQSTEPYTLPIEAGGATNLKIKGFLEEALVAALARGRPLLSRSTRYASFLIADPHVEDRSILQPLIDIVSTTSGDVAGVFTRTTDERPAAEQVSWSEALRVSLDVRNGQYWLLITPDIWIWPNASRRDAIDFMDRRRGNRFNPKHNALLDAWVHIISGTTERNADLTITPFDGGTDIENPTFVISNRTAFARGRAS